MSVYEHEYGGYENGIMDVGIVPYRKALFEYLLRLQFKKAYCAVFAIPYKTIHYYMAKRMLLDNFGFTVEFIGKEEE